MGIDKTSLPNKGQRLFYGYFIVAAAFVIMMVSWGTYTVFGVFFKPLLNEFEWSRGVTSGAFAVSTGIQGFLGIIMGVLTDKFGPRRVVTVCGILLGVGYLLMSQLGALWQLYLFYGLIIGVGMSGIWVPLLTCVARWFVRRRGLMTGIVITGIGIGSFAAPPAISLLITDYGWRQSYLALGSVILVLIVLGAQFLKLNPALMGLKPYGQGENEKPSDKLDSKKFSLKEIMSIAQFWITFVMIFCFGFCMFAIRVHLVPHATDIGISAIDAANVLAIGGAAGILGNFALGGLGDIIGNKRVFILGFILMAAAMFWLLIANDLTTLYVFTVIFGLTFGMGAAESPLMAELFGLRSLGLTIGMLSVGYTVGAAIGPILAGYIFDMTGSYQQAIVISAILGVLGIVLAVLIKEVKAQPKGS